MNTRRKIFFFLLLASIRFFPQTTFTLGNTPVKIDTVCTGLDVPWEIVYGPDNHLWITERKGLISRVNPATKTKQQILDHTSKIFTYAESGMLGLALHPDFPTVPEVFTVYNYGSMQGVHERIVKFTYQNGQLINEIILLDSIRGGAAHNGSRLLFLPDKTLLITLGEANMTQLSQDLTSVNGKVIRMNTDGSVPTDNPFSGSLVYSFGHRNAQGLSFGPGNKIYSSEHGTAVGDEFQVIEPGRNYGWPDVEGLCDLPGEIIFCQTNNVKEPLKEWTPTLAVCDIHWYKNNSFPEFNEKMLMTTLKDKSLVAIELDGSGNYVSEQKYFKEQFGRLRAVSSGPNGEIYLATNGANTSNSDGGTHSIIRLTPPPPVASVKQLTADPCAMIYPSPSDGFIYFECSQVEKGTVVITDLSGKTVHLSDLEKKNRIDISSLSDGIYFVRMTQDQQTMSVVKFVILR